MGDALTGVAAIIGAVGTIITVYLAYRIRVLQSTGNGRLHELTEKNDALHGQVQHLLSERQPPE